jgi:hypothetical protein
MSCIHIVCIHGVVFSEVANTLDEINYNNRIEDFVLISATVRLLDCCLPVFDHSIGLLESLLYQYIGNLYYLHVANITSSLPTAYYSIMSFFLIFFLSFFLFTFFLLRLLSFTLLHFFLPTSKIFWDQWSRGPLYYAALQAAMRVP